MNVRLNTLLFIWLLIFGKPVCAQSILQDAVNKFVAFPEFENASIGIYVMDVNSKQVLINYDGLRLLNPASTTKLFSTALALELLGGDYSPKTTLYYNGMIEGNVLNGDLWIIGGGDMSLGSKYFDKENRQKFLKEWFELIQSKGIKSINGTIYVDASDFGYEGVPDDWLWGDIGNYYGAHFSGAMIYDNLLEYHFKTSNVGKPAELVYTFPKVDSLNFTSNILSSTKSGDNSYIFGAPYSYVREGRGSLPQNNNDFMVKGSLPCPELQLGIEFRRALMEFGCQHNGSVISTRAKKIKKPSETWQKLFEYNGKTVREIARVTNFESINVFAEGLMRLTAFEKTGDGTHDKGSSYMQDYWKGKLNTKALFLNDGSGLARTNAINAKTMCELLVYMNTSKSKVDFYESLPVSGVSGTLKSVARNQPAYGKIHAKSGTMRRTKSYAGYVETDSGKRLAFSFIVNNHICSNKEIVQQMELLMNSLVKE
jgi:D-alanyl-D-alanine carboxypeptidase/D-alanyl-D-alanine-endopeptidase (penicillin-binding protein 4)